MTDQVLAKIDRRRRMNSRSEQTTDLFQSISAMKDFGFTINEWKNVKRIDKRILLYHKIMQDYYDQEAIDRARENAKRQNQFMNKMPKTVQRRR